jgi:putative tryptophan/tyrosine transport system substrate-binding protein
MRRRDFITLLAGTAATWPILSRAQQPATPVVAFLSAFHVPAYLVDAFRRGLGEYGYVEGQNLAFEHRAVNGEYDRFRPIAEDLVRRQVAVIFATGGTAAALAAKSVTSAIPVIFYMGGDPVKQGLVPSLNRPGENLTGLGWLGFALATKRLELLRELVPSATAISLLVNPKNPDSEFEAQDLQAAALKLGQQLHILPASSEAELAGVFSKLAQQRDGALIVASDVLFSGRRGMLVALAARHGVPTIYERRDFPDAGGLISYGHHRADAYRQLGIYTGRILKGAWPGDLPVLQPTKFELVINLNAARALGLEVPPTLLAIADEVIE